MTYGSNVLDVAEPYEAKRWALDQDVGDPLAKLLLVLLANHAGAQGWGWIKPVTLAQQAESDTETVTRWLRILEARRLIVTRKRSGGAVDEIEFMLLMYARDAV